MVHSAVNRRASSREPSRGGHAVADGSALVSAHAAARRFCRSQLGEARVAGRAAGSVEGRMQGGRIGRADLLGLEDRLNLRYFVPLFQVVLHVDGVFSPSPIELLRVI